MAPSKRRVFCALFLVSVLWASAASLATADPRDEDPDAWLFKKASLVPDDAGLANYLRGRAEAGAALSSVGELVARLGDDSFLAREEAAQKLTRLGPVALPKLRAAAKGTDVEAVRRARMCADHIQRSWSPAVDLAVVRRLTKRNPKDALDVLLRFLPYADDPALKEEIWFSLDSLVVRAGAVPPACVEFLADKLPARRAAAAYLAGRRGGAAQQRLARERLTDADEEVRLRAAQGLLGAKDAAGVPALVELIGTGSIDVAWQAEELLRWAAGDTAPDVVVGAGAAGERAKCLAAWRAWWPRQKPETLLAKRYDGTERPGLCLFIGTTFRAQDEEWVLRLIGCDGRVRWELAGLGGRVVDAHLLPGGRVLVAQWKPQDERDKAIQKVNKAYVPGVTERDLSGKIDWRFEGMEFPSLCERLPNGNTFAASSVSRTVAEVNPEGEVVWAWDLKAAPRFFDGDGPEPFYSSSFSSLRRLASGRLLCVQDKPGPRVDLIEFDAAGTPEKAIAYVRKVILIQDNVDSNHIDGIPEPLLGGGYAVAESTTRQKLVIDDHGKTVWRAPFQAWLPVRLRNSNYLLATMHYTAPRMAEVDASGKVVWETFTEYGASRASDSHPLVRLGFDVPRTAGLDLDASVARRGRGLTSPNVIVRRGNATLLAELGPRAAPAVPELIGAFSDTDEGVRITACFTLKKIGPSCLPAVLKAVGDSSAVVRAEAAWACGLFCPEESDVVLPHLTRALKDDDPKVRGRAAFALNKMGPKARPAAAVLIAALADKGGTVSYRDSKVSHWAGLALGNLGPEVPEEAVAALVDVVKATDDPELRRIAIGSLGRIGPRAKAIIPELRKALSADDKTLRRVALEAIEKIEPRKEK